MPNFDAGHYFLTTLAPIRIDACDDGVSHVEAIRNLLADLPTALQSPATESIAETIEDGVVDRKEAEKVNSPFAASRRTHLCRFVVIDDVVYNGRLGSDAIAVALKRAPDPLSPQHIDRLPSPYLLFSADIDAILKPGDPLPDELTVDQQNAVRDSYAREVWEIAGETIKKLYSHCQGFDGVDSAEAFAAYLAKCQVETWMPFNDYYIDYKTELKGLEPLNTKKIARVAGPPIVLTLLCLAVGLLDSFIELAFQRNLVNDWIWLGVPIFGLASAVAIQWAYNYAMNLGATSWPAAKYGSLTAVLKGLYTQQHFADFVIENQGKSAADLHKNFGAFLKKYKPSEELDEKTTQLPGVIGSVARPRRNDKAA